MAQFCTHIKMRLHLSTFALSQRADTKKHTHIKRNTWDTSMYIISLSHNVLMFLNKQQGYGDDTQTHTHKLGELLIVELIAT